MCRGLLYIPPSCNKTPEFEYWLTHGIGLHGKRDSTLQLCRPNYVSYQHSSSHTVEFTKYREVGKFAISFWRPNVQKLSASGGLAPWLPPGALPPWTPTGGFTPDPYYRLALPRSPCAPFPPFAPHQKQTGVISASVEIKSWLRPWKSLRILEIRNIHFIRI